jgi:hypothetical protein
MHPGPLLRGPVVIDERARVHDLSPEVHREVREDDLAVLSLTSWEVAGLLPILAADLSTLLPGLRHEPGSPLKVGQERFRQH